MESQRIIESIETGLAGHPSRLPSRAWRDLFKKRMDDWLKNRGLKTGMQDLVSASVRESLAKKKRKENEHDVD